jgi:hypothetical protein
MIKYDELQAMRKCAALLPPPGEEIVIKLLDEIDKYNTSIMELQERDRWLCALEAAGVDNWEGMENAQDIFDEFTKEN